MQVQAGSLRHRVNKRSQPTTPLATQPCHAPAMRPPHTATHRHHMLPPYACNHTYALAPVLGCTWDGCTSWAHTCLIRVSNLSQTSHALEQLEQLERDQIFALVDCARQPRDQALETMVIGCPSLHSGERQCEGELQVPCAKSGGAGRWRVKVWRVGPAHDWTVVTSEAGGSRREG